MYIQQTGFPDGTIVKNPLANAVDQEKQVWALG